MIIIPILIFLAMIIAKIKKGLFASFLVLVATKSVVDAFWNFKLGPLSIMSLQGALIPILFYQILKHRKMIPKFWLNTANIYLIALSLGVFWALPIKPIATFEIIILNLNIYLGFILIPLLINDKKKLKQFLLAIMICGIFPVLVSIFQLQTGIIFRERVTIGLSRYVGFYHDAFPTRFYGLMTLMSILIYQSVYKINSFFFKIFLLLLSSGALVSMYAVFSKAAVSIIVVWIVILLLFSKTKVKQSFTILIGALVIILVFGDAVSGNIEQLFSKELGYQSGDVKDARYTLAGRGYIWQKYWDFWSTEQSIFFQLFGDGIDRPVHNEFFRVLLVNGILGLFSLIIFLVNMILNTFKIHRNIRVFGMMLLAMYSIDCIGLVPGSYYYYNILVWGIFGTLLMKPQLFIKQT